MTTKSQYQSQKYPTVSFLGYQCDSLMMIPANEAQQSLLCMQARFTLVCVVERSIPPTHEVHVNLVFNARYHLTLDTKIAQYYKCCKISHRNLLFHQRNRKSRSSGCQSFFSCVTPYTTRITHMWQLRSGISGKCTGTRTHPRINTWCYNTSKWDLMVSGI